MSTHLIRVDDQTKRGLDSFGAGYERVSDGAPVVNASDISYGSILEGSNFMFLPAKDGPEGHPDLWYSKYRLGVNGFVRAIADQAKINVADTAQEKNRRMYLGNINYQQALKLNLLLGGKTTNMAIEVEVFRMLLSGEAVDGNGMEIDKRELEGILDEKIGVRGPERGEWLEDSFEEIEGKIFLMKNYVLQNGVLVPNYTKPLQECLTESKTPGIDFNNFVINPNAQGWPRADVKRGKTYYWPPTAGRVSGLLAYSDRASLFGFRCRQGASSRLGVRHLRVAPKK